MKRIHLAITAIMGLLALTAITSIGIATAAEVTKILPEPTAKEQILATVDVPNGGILWSANGSHVTCTRGGGDVNFTSPNLGTGLINYSGCTSTLSSRCTGEGDASGIILTKGTVHYVLALEMITATTTTLVGAFAILQPPVHFTCEFAGVKELVIARGCVAGRDESDEELTEHIPIIFRQWATGQTRILEILPPEATSRTDCLLESANFREGAEERFELSALVGEGGLLNPIKDEKEGTTKLITLLLMN
jgi:hypothetical protein